MRKRVLIDVDGPLTRGFVAAYCALLRKRGILVYTNMISEWSIVESFNIPETIEREIQHILCKPGVATSFYPRTGAKEFLTELRKWADVYAVTAPLDGSPTWVHERENWLVNNLDFNPEEIVFARDKSIISGDAFIDDKVILLQDWIWRNPGKLAIRWEEPYNKFELWSGASVNGYEQLGKWLAILKE